MYYFTKKNFVNSVKSQAYFCEVVSLWLFFLLKSKHQKIIQTIELIELKLSRELERQQSDFQDIIHLLIWQRSVRTIVYFQILIFKANSIITSSFLLSQEVILR